MIITPPALPPTNREVGQGDPAADMDQVSAAVSDVVTALNGLDTRYLQLAATNSSIVVRNGQPALRDQISIKDYGAVGNTKKVLDGAIMAGANTLSSTSAVFTSADVGKSVCIAGAGTQGSNLYQPLNAIISSVSSGVATLSTASNGTTAVNAVNTVSGAVVYYGTDDTADIQAALNAASAFSEVYIPVAIYFCSNSLVIPSYVRLRGISWSSVLFFNFTTTAVATSYLINQNYNNTSGDTSIEVRDFTVQGAWFSGIPAGTPVTGNNNWCSGVFTRRLMDLHVEHLQVTNVPGISIAYQGVISGRFLSNTVRNSGRDGITGGPFLEHALSDILIEGNHIDRVGDDAIAVHAYPDSTNHNTTAAPKQIRVIGNRIHSADQYYGTTGTASITTGTTAVSSISPVMNPATDVGKIMAINGAVASAQITAIAAGGASCTLAVTATATVTSAACAWANQAGRGIYLHGIVDSVCIGNEVDSTFSDGILVAADTTSGDGPGGTGGWRCTNVITKDNVVNGGGQMGDLSQPRYGMYLESIDHCKADGNVVYNSYAAGIVATDFTYSSIENNHSYNNGTQITDFGIWLYGVSSSTANVIAVSCRNNKVTNNAGGGIYAYYCPHLTLDGNECYSNGNANRAATFTDAVLNSTTTLTSATAAFTIADNGGSITGTGIPTGATMAYVNSTTVTLSAAATATATGVTITLVAGTNTYGSGMLIYNNGVLMLRNNKATDLRSSGKTQTNGINIHDVGIIMAADNYSTNNVSGFGIIYNSPQTVLLHHSNYTSATASSNYQVEYSGVYIMSGTGTPLGNISGPVGSIYMRSDGGTSTTLYVKESGTSNTGWVAK